MKHCKFFTLIFLSWVMSPDLSAQSDRPSVSYPFDQQNQIISYLREVAVEITRHSLQSLPDLQTWEAQIPARQHELARMLGLQDKPLNKVRSAPIVTHTGVIQEDGYRIEKIFYESLPNLYVPANLYIPDGISKPVPAILYVCGHAHSQKHHYQAHARSFAKNGFVCLIIETIQFGEVRGEHLGAESRGWFHWYSRGYNPGGVEVWNGIRGIDLLCQLPEVDRDKIGVTGISGGGSQSWYLPALDNRIKAIAAVAGAASIEGQICQRTIDDHCDCMMPINTYGIDFSDVGALIAPRPFLIAQTTGDGYYSIEAVRTLFQKIKPVYSLYGQPDLIWMAEAPGGHSYGAQEEFRPLVLSFFLRELMGIDRRPEDLPAIDITHKRTEQELKVFVNGVPENDLTKIIHDHFVPMAKPPVIQGIDDLNAYRKKVKEQLMEQTFRAFPRIAPPVDLRLEFKDDDFGKHGRQIYSLVTEEGWRLKFSLHRQEAPDEKTPLLLVLINPEEERWDRYQLTSGLQSNFNIAYFETRGVGETGWSSSLQWHIRRSAAWTGRTIASMRVYDVIRCLQALRSLPGIDPDYIYLAAQGEMAAVASYAALLDGNIKTLILKDPPATQNNASETSGKGETLEMLNCLQFTDLPQVAGLMFPHDLVVTGKVPDSYLWVADLYRNLGKLENYQVVQKVSEWKSK